MQSKIFRRREHQNVSSRTQTRVGRGTLINYYPKDKYIHPLRRQSGTIYQNYQCTYPVTPKLQFQDFIPQIKLICVQNGTCKKPIFAAMSVLAKV